MSLDAPVERGNRSLLPWMAVLETDIMGAKLPGKCKGPFARLMPIQRLNLHVALQQSSRRYAPAGALRMRGAAGFDLPRRENRTSTVPGGPGAAP